ncbi:MAG: NUDIX hydrolase [Acidimicrobiales bacterium]
MRAAFAGQANPLTAPSEVPERTPVRESNQQVELPSRDPRPAAVLCALFDDAGQAAVVLTRRSTRLRSHTGEVSLPGGRLDPGETAVEAALREAREEVGLDPARVEIVGALHPLATYSSRSAIRPFVGILDRQPELRPNPAEVDRVFTVTLVELVSPGAYHDEVWPPRHAPIHFFDVPGETIWGATARMLRDLLDRVLPVKPPTTSVEDGTGPGWVP